MLPQPFFPAGGRTSCSWGAGLLSSPGDRGVFEIGAGFAVIFSSVSRNRRRGRQTDREVARAGSQDSRPQCQGLVTLRGDPSAFSFRWTPTETGGGRAYVSQSGAFGFASFAMAADAGAGFRYVVTTGNQSDLDVIDFARFLSEDPEVRLLLLYLEGITDGMRFLELLRFAHGKSLPVAVLKVGRSAVAREAAKSHTAALTGDENVWEAVFRQYGVLTLSAADDVTDVARMSALPRGPGATGSASSAPRAVQGSSPRIPATRSGSRYLPFRYP